MASQNSAGRDAVRALIARGAEGDLEPREAEQLESALAADPDLAAELLAPLHGEEFLLDEPVAMPSEFEWKRIEKGIEAGVAGDAASTETSAAPAKTDRAPSAGTGRGKPGLTLPLILLTAATVVCALVVRMIMNDGLAAPETPPMAEMIELRDDADYRIILPEEEDGGVIIVVHNS